MDQKRAATRIFCLIARKAPVGVVFRRGPSKQVQLLRWDLKRDVFEPGQWLKGRIYERRCDLSPSGRLLIYFAASNKPPLHTWTAVSRPPFLTALVLWPKGDAWGGGGLFQNERKILLNHRVGEQKLDARFRLPRKLRVEPLGEHAGGGEDDPIFATRLERDGWRLVDQGVEKKHPYGSEIWFEYDPPVTWVRRHAGGARELVMELRGIKQREGPWYVLSFRMRGPQGEVDLGACDWADLLPGGDVAFARDGRIYRCGEAEDPSGREPLVDLRDNVFEEMAPSPEARQWPKVR